MNKIVRILLAIFLPPLAVIDKGFDKLAIVTALWLIMGPIGILAALYFVLDGSAYDRWRRSTPWMSRYRPEAEKAKRTPQRSYRHPDANYLEREDGEIIEIIDTADEERRQRLRR